MRVQASHTPFRHGIPFLIEVGSGSVVVASALNGHELNPADLGASHINLRSLIRRIL